MHGKLSQYCFNCLQQTWSVTFIVAKYILEMRVVALI